MGARVETGKGNKPMTKYQIREESLRTHYSMIPNIIDDLDLSPYDVRLYMHIKRVAGENGTCFQSLKTMSDACRMSRPMVCKSKERLENMGLIAIKKGDPLNHICDTLLIIDIWDKNQERALSKRGDRGVVTTFTRGGHQVDSKNTPIKNNNISPDSNSAEGTDVEGVKTPAEETLPIISTTREIQKAFEGVCGYKVRWEEREGESAKWLSVNGYSAEEVVACYKHLKVQEFWIKKPLRLSSVIKQIGEWKNNYAGKKHRNISW